MYKYKKLKSGGEGGKKLKQRMNSRRKRKEKKREKKESIGAHCWETLSVEVFSLRLSFLVYKMGKCIFFGGVL